MPPKKKSDTVKKSTIPEDFELSDEEPAVVNLDEGTKTVK